MFFVPAEKRTRYAPTYVKKDGKLTAAGGDFQIPLRRQPFISGGGGLVTTIPDFRNLCQMLVDQGEFNGRRVLRPATVEQIFTKQAESHYESPGHVGLGFSVRPIELGKNNRPATVHGWKGATAAYFLVVPKERLFQIFMGHMLPESWDFQDRLFTTVFDGVQ